MTTARTPSSRSPTSGATTPTGSCTPRPGQEIHPLGHPDRLLLDFTSYDYEVAWGERVVSELTRDGFTGVNVVDGGNLPLWDGVPVVNNADLHDRVPRRCRAAPGSWPRRFPW